MSTENTSKKPTHYVFAVTDRKGSDKSFWARIGSAWTNSDGKGFSLKLDLMPLNGADIVVREPLEEDTRTEA